MSLREQWSMMCLRSVFFHLFICFNTGTVQRENYDNGNHRVKGGVGPIYIYIPYCIYFYVHPWVLVIMSQEFFYVKKGLFSGN